MTKREVAHGPGGSIVLMDSITRVTPDDAGAIVVSASHGAWRVALARLVAAR